MQGVADLMKLNLNEVRMFAFGMGLEMASLLFTISNFNDLLIL